MRKSKAAVVLLAVLVLICAAVLVFLLALSAPDAGKEAGGEASAAMLPAGGQAKPPANPDELIPYYASLIEAGDYDAMYELIDPEGSTLGREEFLQRNKGIYEGIGAKNIAFEVTGVEDDKDSRVQVNYSARLDTLAGEISFDNKAVFVKGEDGQYRLEWSSRMIFPRLSENSRVRVNTLRGERGGIYDRNGEMLAGPGIASSVGFVPGKMLPAAQEAVAEEGQAPDDDSPQDAASGEVNPSESEDDGALAPSGEDIAADDAGGDEAAQQQAQLVATREEGIQRIAELLEMTPESIEKKLGASYVKDDTFVALKTVPKEAYDLKEQLLTVPGIKIVDAQVRFYPLGERASQLTGYVQSISAEELDELADKGYTKNSVLGKAGLERICEDTLRATDGVEIVITGADGETLSTLAKIDKHDGENIKLTIDSSLQSELYDGFATDRSCSVAIDPLTGEVLALVSTPSYDANDFILGFSEAKWAQLNESEDKPLYNRFRAALCPGSVFKAITGAIAIDTGSVGIDESFGHSGLEWRRDQSWGGYYITTLKDYGQEATLKRAITHSDNIYFAKAALQIGAERFAKELIELGFEERIPFEYALYSSIVSGTESFTSEIQLADSGYGQGEILVNPVHLASVYAAFLNGGDMPAPYLFYSSGAIAETWKKGAFSSETADVMLDALVSVVENGTGTDAKISGAKLAGKTGTAEIKQSKDDEEGTELGWFVLMNADKAKDRPLLIVSMAEDVKDRGGSRYVMPKVKAAFESWLERYPR